MSCHKTAKSARRARTGDRHVVLVGAATLDGRRDDWTRLEPPRDLRRCYNRKKDALSAFAREPTNQAVIEEYGGLFTRTSASEFDAINHKYGLKGKRAARNIAEALWEAMPPGKPFCLDNLDIDALNDTSPARVAEERLGLRFALPPEAMNIDEQWRLYEEYLQQRED